MKDKTDNPLTDSSLEAGANLILDNLNEKIGQYLEDPSPEKLLALKEYQSLLAREYKSALKRSVEFPKGDSYKIIIILIVSGMTLVLSGSLAPTMRNVLFPYMEASIPGENLNIRLDESPIDIPSLSIQSSTDQNSYLSEENTEIGSLDDDLNSSIFSQSSYYEFSFELERSLDFISQHIPSQKMKPAGEITTFYNLKNVWRLILLPMILGASLTIGVSLFKTLFRIGSNHLLVKGKHQHQ